MTTHNPEYCYDEAIEDESVARATKGSYGCRSVLQVKMDEFGVGDSSFNTQDCYNCIGLAAIGPELGLIGHFERISDDFPTFQPVFNNALRALAFVQPRLIVLVGGRADYGIMPSDKISLADRTFAADALSKFVQEDPNSPELRVRWNTQQYECVDLLVYTEEKLIIATHYIADEE